MTRFFAVAWKELLQLRRDKPTVIIMVGFPVMQLLLFGYAINTDVRHIPTVVYDQDQSAESRDMVRRLEATGFYQVLGEVRDYEEMERAMRSGSARVSLVFPSDFAEQLRAGGHTAMQLVVDGSDPQTVASATNTAASLAAQRSLEVVVGRLKRSAMAVSVTPLALEPVTWYNPEIRTAIYVVPGLVGVILTMTMIMLTSMAIARERERGTLEQLIVSPVRRTELIAGKILPYVAIGYVQMSLILMVGHLVFNVPISGSVPLLYTLASVFIAANLSLGLVFSTLAKTQQQAMQMSFFFILPNILLSGFMFPFEAMPRPAQWISQALPLTHFMRIVRGITLKGASFHDVSQELVWLVCIFGILFTLAATRFTKKLV
jgi:ABC-2 type transport system permease protein